MVIHAVAKIHYFDVQICFVPAPTLFLGIFIYLFIGQAFCQKQRYVVQSSSKLKIILH